MSSVVLGSRPGFRAADAVGQPLAWAIVGCLLLIDLFWGARVGLSIGGCWKAAGIVCGLLVLSTAYKWRDHRVADIAECAALWVAFSAEGCVLTYLCAASALPLQDAVLTDLDHALGFDWLAWRDTVLALPALHWVLARAYASLTLQIVVIILFLPTRGLTERSVELFRLAVLTLLATALISALWPALGPFATFGAFGGNGAYMHDLLTVRAGGPWHFDLPAMQGIVTMPSYHIVLAVLLTYACRGTGPIGWGIAGLNVLMLLSIPPIGGHYLVDMIAGGAIALVCVLGSRLVDHLRRKSHVRPAPAI